jgi:hypothetical protein
MVLVCVSLTIYLLSANLTVHPVSQLPEAITTPPALRADQVTELSVAARGFLLNLAQIAYNECEHPVRPESDNSSEVRAVSSMW